MPITITQKDGLVEFACPMCLRPMQLPPSEYDCGIKDGHMTVTKKHIEEGENPYRIDLKKQDGHTVNCDFVLINAPIVIAEPTSSQDAQTGEQ